jgi:succinyl-CoA synthetase beta subunit
MTKNPERTMVVRLRGNNQDKAEQMLAKSGIKLFQDLEEAVKEAIAKSKVKQAVGAKA